MTSRYKILFALELRHSYYSDGKCKDFELVPSEATRKLLNDCQFIFKAFENQLWVLTKVAESGGNKDKPVIAPGPQQRFVFYLRLQRPQFMNVTNLDVDAFPAKRFYFSNTAKNKAETVLYLTAPVADYATTADYRPGMFAKTSTGDVFEAIKENPHGSESHNTTDRAFWKPRGKEQFASSADMLPVVGNTARFNMSSVAGNFTVKAFALNPADNKTFDIEMPLRKNKALTFADTGEEGVKSVQVDLSGLVPGRYRVQINDSSFVVYVDDAAVDQDVFGVIDIYNHLPSGDDFALLDSAGKTKDKVVGGVVQWLTFTIQFANRLAYLKYIALKRGISRITDNRAEAEREYSFTPSTPGPPQFFVSNKPVPLVQKQTIFDIELVHSIGSEAIKAPTPNPAETGMLSRTGNEFFSTVYLNY